MCSEGALFTLGHKVLELLVQLPPLDRLDLLLDREVVHAACLGPELHHVPGDAGGPLDQLLLLLLRSNLHVEAISETTPTASTAAGRWTEHWQTCVPKSECGE